MMKTITAQLNSYRHAPRKVRLVASMIKGKSVPRALAELSFLPKKAAFPISKLIRSALASAKSANLSEENLIIKTLSVDGGPILYRRRPASRGRAPLIRKRTSHVKVVLESLDDKVAKKTSKKMKLAKAKESEAKK